MSLTTPLVARATLRKSFSGFRVRMRTVFVPYNSLHPSKPDAEVAAGHAEHTVILCVELEQPGEAPEAFLVDAVDVTVDGARVRLLPWCKESLQEIFPLRLGVHERCNLLFAVELLNSPVSDKGAPFLNVSMPTSTRECNAQSQSWCGDSRFSMCSRTEVRTGRSWITSYFRHVHFLHAGIVFSISLHSGPQLRVKEEVKYYLSHQRHFPPPHHACPLFSPISKVCRMPWLVANNLSRRLATFRDPPARLPAAQVGASFRVRDTSRNSHTRHLASQLLFQVPLVRHTRRLRAPAFHPQRRLARCYPWEKRMKHFLAARRE